jgi:flavin-dependent dehydrogenase
LAALGTPAVRRTVFHYSEDASFADGPDRGAVDVAIKPRYGVDALYAPRRTVLDRMLVDAAREAGAEVHHRVGLLTVTRDQGERVCGATFAPEGSDPCSVRARWLIGADGRRSSVARMVRAPITRAGEAATATLYGYYDGLQIGDAEPTYRWLYAPELGSGVIPTDGGQACVFVGAHPERIARAIEGRGNEHALRTLLAGTSRELAAAIDRAQLVGKPWVFMGAPGFSRCPRGPGWALVGDAGAFRDPLTANGISDALRDAELLARALLADSDAALIDYEQARDSLNDDSFALTEKIAALDWSLQELPFLHRQLNKAMSVQCDLIMQTPAPANDSAAPWNTGGLAVRG